MIRLHTWFTYHTDKVHFFEWRFPVFSAPLGMLENGIRNKSSHIEWQKQLTITKPPLQKPFYQSMLVRSLNCKRLFQRWLRLWIEKVTNCRDQLCKNKNGLPLRPAVQKIFKKLGLDWTKIYVLSYFPSEFYFRIFFNWGKLGTEILKILCVTKKTWLFSSMRKRKTELHLMVETKHQKWKSY